MRNLFPRFPVRQILFGVLIIVVFMMSTSSVVFSAAGIPDILHYQGRLLNNNGNLLGGTGTAYCFRFSFFDDEIVGVPDTRLWPSGTPSDMTATATNGVFVAGIGDTANGGDALDYPFTDDAVYLNIEIATVVGGSCGGGDESYENLEPRQHILSSAYAVTAGTVFGTNQSAIGTTSIADNAMLTLEATSTSAIPLFIRRMAGQVSNLLEVATEAATSLFTVTSSGNVGIGTSTPTAHLVIEGMVGQNLLQVATAADQHILTITENGYLGVGTSSPGSIFSVNGITNFTSATSTFYGTGGIDIMNGCFSVGGTCIPTSVEASKWTDSTTYLIPNDNSRGIIATASSTILGNFTITGNATTSGLLEVNGIGTSTFAGNIDTLGNASSSNVYVENRFDGAGLTDCSNATSTLQWNESTGQFICNAPYVPDFLHYTDITSDAVADDNTTDYWDGTYPNIVPSSEGSEVLVMVTVGLEYTAGTEATVAMRIEREDDEPATDPTCGSETQVGAELVSSGRVANEIGVTVSGVFVDAPATTTQVRYTLCADDETVGTTATVTDIHFTLYEVNNMADLAEVFPTNDTSLNIGDIVSVDSALPEGVAKTATSGDEHMLGVVSSAPALAIGGTGGIGATGVPVALSGRVPVKVTAGNGEIAVGDVITSGTLPGTGIKAINSGRVLGIALQPFSEDDEILSTADGDAYGMIVMFVNPHWYGGNSERFAEWFDLENLVLDEKNENEGDLTGIRKWLFHALQSLGLVLEKGVATLSELFADRIVVKNADIREAVLGKVSIETLSVEHSFEMTDEHTGEIFCMTLRDGVLAPEKGACGTEKIKEEVNEPPGITILGNNPARVAVGSAYNDLGTLVEDDTDTNLGVKEFVDGIEVSAISLDTSVPREYVIMYQAEDQNGNITSVERIVIIGDGIASDTEAEVAEEAATGSSDVVENSELATDEDIEIEEENAHAETAGVSGEEGIEETTNGDITEEETVVKEGVMPATEDLESDA